MFSKEWEDIFKANTHISVWPWSDLVSYVSRHARPPEQFRRVLELGCGSGANLPFFLKKQCEYHAVEGSRSAVTRIHEIYPSLKDFVRCDDFTRNIPFAGPFDLVVDRAATAHNATGAIAATLGMVAGRLRAGGKFIGIDWFSTAHEGARRGTAVDAHTRRDILGGSLDGLGEVHFFDRGHLVEMLEGAGFAIERLEHKCNDVYLPAAEGTLAWWNFVAVKK
jgi:SAM-dependent methyltransferase